MNKPTALIIEDDVGQSIVFAEALKAGGFETEIIRDGEIAIQRLSAITPEVIVLDMHLPHVAGMDILRQIRADDRLAETRIIVATADAAMAQEIREQADLVLVKPISFKQLRDLAARVGSVAASEE